MKRLERVDEVIHTYNGCAHTSTQHQQARVTDLRRFEAEACLGLLGGGALFTCRFLLPVVQERTQGDAFQRRLQARFKRCVCTGWSASNAGRICRMRTPRNGSAFWHVQHRGCIKPESTPRLQHLPA